SLSRFPLWVGLAPILLGRLDLAFPVPPPLRQAVLHRLPWREQVGRQLHPEPRPEDLLGGRAEIDSTLPAVMLRLVGLRRVNPNPPRSVYVDRSHQANLLRSHSRKSHQLHHGPQLGRDVRPDRFNESIGDRLNRLRLTNIGPATAEAGYCNQSMMKGRRDNPLPDGPLEQSDDPARSLVNLVPA